TSATSSTTGRRRPASGTASTPARSSSTPQRDVEQRADDEHGEHHGADDSGLRKHVGGCVPAEVADQTEGDAPGDPAEGVPEEELAERHLVDAGEPSG